MVNVYVSINGHKLWLLDGRWHRVNGPALVWANGVSEWYFYDLQVTEYEHMMLMAQETISG